MKKFSFVFALFILFFAVSCDSGVKFNNPNDINSDAYQGDSDQDTPDDDSGDTVDSDTDTSNTGITDVDNDDSDTTPEQPDDGDTAADTGDNGDSEPDNDVDTDSGDTVPDQDADTDSDDTLPDQDADADTDTAVPSMVEGIYLGIIGFNDDLTKMPIKRLTDSNKSEFKSFISSLPQLNYTALYWADYSALEMMESFAISPDLQLKKVALVTFTDGLDNQSLSSDDFNPGPYDSHADYLDAIHSMIMDEDGIHGQPVTAYSIGLKGADVTDEAKFENTLEMLATEESGDKKYFFRVSDMNEVGQLFADIAASLYSVSTTINVGVYIPGGYDNGQVIRYTFDNVSAATNSNLYIEATYHRSGSSRTLENIKYEGFIPGASTISSSATGPNNELYFQFNDLKYSNGDPVSQSEIISKSRLWKQTSSGAWDGETEMNMAELPPIIDEDKSSALIMLVLDSTTSLGSDFARMQNEAKNFVEILVNGGSGVTESSPCDDNPCATLANSTHICTVSGSSYTCGCNSGYTWNGWQCTSTSTPCNPNPCTSISNSTGVCTVNGTGYTCGCQSGYTWNGSSCQSNGGSSLPECSASSGTPCKDSSSGLTWSAKASTCYTWQNAVDYCNSYSEGGLSGWHLPTISELRTLIKNCSGTVTGGSCGVTDSCLSSSCQDESCYSCDYYEDGRYSKFGEIGGFWSSSTSSDSAGSAWVVGFLNGPVDKLHKTYNLYVRCVRNTNLNTGDESGNQAQSGKIGAACTSHSQCTQTYGSGDSAQTATCLTQSGDGFPGGYCTFFGDLTDSAACDSTEELFYNFGGSWGSGLCLHKCTKPSDCRAGYRCSDKIQACLPDCTTAGYECMYGTCDQTDGVCLKN